MVNPPASPSAGANDATSRRTIPGHVGTRRSTIAASALASGTLRRVQARQPPPRSGGFTEKVKLPAGPLAGAVAATWNDRIIGTIRVKWTVMAASAPTSGTPRRCRPRQPPPRRGGLTEVVHLPAGPEAGAAAAPRGNTPSRARVALRTAAAVSVPLTGTLRRFLPRQPPPWPGGLAE